jgi:hypothetical protein
MKVNKRIPRVIRLEHGKSDKRKMAIEWKKIRERFNASEIQKKERDSVLRRMAFRENKIGD